MKTHSILRALPRLILMPLLSLAAAGVAFGADNITENFSGPTLGSSLADPQARFQVSGGTAHITTSGGPADRAYIRTVSTDYSLTNFVCEVTVNSPSDPSAIMFVGLGSGTPSGSYGNEPQDSVYLRIHSPDHVGGFGGNEGRVDVATLTGAGLAVILAQNFGDFGFNPGSHRIRITKTGDQLVFDLDQDFNGTFAVDYSYTISSVSTTAPFLNASNSALFFGTGRTSSSFDDLNVTADPATSVVAVKGDAAPGAPVGSTFSTFGIPSLRPGGQQAFLSTTKIGTASVAAIYAGAPPTLLVKKGDAAPGLAGLTFASFKDPILNDQGSVALLATLAGAGVVSANNAAVFSTDIGSLSLVAREGDVAPDTAGAVFLSFSSVALPDGDNGVVFTAKLVGTTAVPGPGGVVSTNNFGLWAADSVGALRLLARAGSSVNVAGTPKTIKTLTVLGAVSGASDQAHAASAQAEVLYRVTFSDGTQALLKTAIP